jgi:hypothetical protein
VVNSLQAKSIVLNLTGEQVYRRWGAAGGMGNVLRSNLAGYLIRLLHIHVNSQFMQKRQKPAYPVSTKSCNKGRRRSKSKSNSKRIIRF